MFEKFNNCSRVSSALQIVTLSLALCLPVRDVKAETRNKALNIVGKQVEPHLINNDNALPYCDIDEIIYCEVDDLSSKHTLDLYLLFNVYHSSSCTRKDIREFVRTKVGFITRGYNDKGLEFFFNDENCKLRVPGDYLDEGGKMIIMIIIGSMILLSILKEVINLCLLSVSSSKHFLIMLC